MIKHKDHFHGSDLEKIEEIYGIKKEEIVSFSANVNPLGVSPLLKHTLSDQIDAITSYPDREYTSLRRCIAAYCGTETENVIVGNGSTELISLFIQVEHPKKALVIGPTYSEYEREIALGGGMFFDHSDWPGYGEKARQTSLEARAKIARGFGRSSFSLEAGYERLAGQKSISENTQQLIHAALRYGFAGGGVRLDVGADYYHDKIEGADAENYVIPYARLDFNLGTPGLRPFFEADGAVKPNDFRSLTLQNPYVTVSTWLDKSSVDYDFRLGVGGSLWRSRFSYRLYAGVSIHDNRLFWTALWSDDPENAGFFGAFVPVTARQTVTSFNGEIEYRPVSVLKFDLAVHGCLYNDETDLKNGAPSIAGNVGVAYEGRKVSFGVKALMQGVRRWTVIDLSATTDASEPVCGPSFEAPFGVDLRVNFDWKVSGRITLFAEGRNLINRRLYQYPWYPEYGANFTVGVKANF